MTKKKDTDERVLVHVRVRPLTAPEMGQQVVVSHEGSKKLMIVKEGKGATAGRCFGFDRVYWSIDGGSIFDTQFDIYEDIGKQMLDHAFSGFNTCIFAYGQTGSGKTYTMMGDQKSTSETAQGIIPRACCELFSKIDENYTLVDLQQDSDTKPVINSYEVACSYYEIYNEKVYDLLDPSKSKDDLKVREHPIHGPYVEGLTCNTVSLYDDVQALLLLGNRHRHTNQTKLNDSSSRSHAIFTIILKQSVFKEGELSEYVSRINLVDLAGSERTKNAGTSGEVLHEGININRSLCTLGQVIHNLAEAHERHRDTYINFRDSHLTWLLRENLGGNSKTIMVATISPSGSCYDESLNTLRYADRVKQIRQRATVNEDSKTKLIRDLRQEVAQLRKEAMEFAKLKREVTTLRKTVHGGLDPAELQNELIGDHPYVVILKPNPTPKERVIHRLCSPVVFLTETKDNSTTRDLLSRHASKIPIDAKACDVGIIKIPGLTKVAGVFVLPNTNRSKSAFGNRPCMLIPLAQDVDGKREIGLQHGYVYSVGDLAFRYADPTSVTNEDQLIAACHSTAIQAKQENIIRSLTNEQQAQYASLTADQKEFFLSKQCDLSELPSASAKQLSQERSDLLTSLTNEGPVTQRHVKAVFDILGETDLKDFNKLSEVQRQIFIMNQPSSATLKAMTPTARDSYRKEQRKLLQTLKTQQQCLSGSQLPAKEVVPMMSSEDQKVFESMTPEQQKVFIAGQPTASEIANMSASEATEYQQQQKELLTTIIDAESSLLAHLSESEMAEYKKLTPEQQSVFLKRSAAASNAENKVQNSKQLLSELSTSCSLPAKLSDAEVDAIVADMDPSQRELYRKLTASQKQFFMSQQIAPSAQAKMTEDEKKQFTKNQERLLSALLPSHSSSVLSEGDRQAVVASLTSTELKQFESLTPQQKEFFMSRQLPSAVASQLSEAERAHISDERAKLLSMFSSTTLSPKLTQSEQQELISSLPEADQKLFAKLTPSQKQLFWSQQLPQQTINELPEDRRKEVLNQQRALLKLCEGSSTSTLSASDKRSIVSTLSAQESAQFNKLSASQQEIFLSHQPLPSEVANMTDTDKTTLANNRKELFASLQQHSSVMTNAHRDSVIAKLPSDVKSQFETLTASQQEFFISQQTSSSTKADYEELLSVIKGNDLKKTTQSPPPKQQEALTMNIETDSITLTSTEMKIIENLPEELFEKFESLDSYQKRVFLSMQDPHDNSSKDQEKLLSALLSSTVQRTTSHENMIFNAKPVGEDDHDYSEVLSKLTPQQQKVFMSLTPRDKHQFCTMTREHQLQIAELTPRQRQQFMGLTPRQQKQFLEMTPRGADNNSPTPLTSEQLKLLSEVTSADLPPLDMRSVHPSISHGSPSSSIVTSVGPITTGGRRGTNPYGEDIDELKAAHEGILSQVIEEGKRDLRLMELQVTEAQKELEAKEKLLEEIRRELHTEREAYERRLTESETQHKEIIEEAFREQVKKSAQAEECISVLEIQFRDAEERHNLAMEELANELSEAQAKLMATEAQLEADRFESENARVLHVTTTQKLEETHLTLQSMKSALTETTERVRLLKDDLTDKTTCVDALQQKIERMQEIENYGKQRISELQKEHFERELHIQRNYDAMQKLRQEEHEKAEKLRQQHRVTQEDLAQRERELRYLKELADQKEIAKAAVEAQCNQLRERVEGTQEELSRIQNEIKGCEEMLRQKESQIKELHGEKTRLSTERAKETDQQRKLREKEMVFQQDQIRDLSEQITVIQNKARVIQQKNRDLYQNQERIRERRIKLEAELAEKEQELRETKGKYLETHQRLQTTIRRGKKEHEQLSQLRKLTSLVKEQEMRIEYLQKELKESLAHNKRLEDTQAGSHSVDQVEAVKRDMNNILSILKAEVIQFSPPALRQVQAIVNAVQHAVDPRRIFRQAFNHIRLVVTEISGNTQKHGVKWDVQESSLGLLKTFQRASVLKALREIVVWYGVSSDFARQEMTAYTELTSNSKFLILLAKFCQNPSMPDLPSNRHEVVKVNDINLRPLILAARRGKSAGRKEKDRKDLESTDTLNDPPPSFAATLPCTMMTSPIPCTLSLASHRSRSKGEHSVSATPPSAERSRSELVSQTYDDRKPSIPRHVLNCTPAGKGTRTRARSPNGQSNLMSYSTDKLAERLAANTVAYYSKGQSPQHFRIPVTDDELDDSWSKKKGEIDPKKKNFMQGTVSSQGKEVHSRGFPLAVHMMRKSVRYTKPARPY